MKTYITLLRGINVSGQKKIKMTDLKACMEELKFSDVRTYIQSGNVVFKYETASLPELEKKIEQKIAKTFGFEVTTIVKTPAELESVIENNQFLKDPDKDPNRVYVTFLSEHPEAIYVEKIATIDNNPEEFMLDGKVIYFFSPHGYGRAKMNNNFFEKKLKVKTSTRNWKTVNKLLEISRQ